MIDPLEQAWMRAQVRARMFGGDPVVRVGRFELGERLGAGAMGTVWRARDPELSREVALKMLRGAGDDERLRREAQAMARLRHPNVVAVHEIGAWQGLAFVAMERVEGPTVRAWLAERRRGVGEILALFAGAGRGLAAAHAAGLVHRDFKPDNVLVDSSGAARVADFGLAHDGDEEPALTGGTPAYMAPEQLRGRGATARSDQFAFAVALYEALYGMRPFVGGTAGELAAAIEAGIPRGFAAAKAAVGAVPARARRAVFKALAADPAARHADVEAMLRELAPPPRRAMGWLAGALVLALGVAVAWIATRPAAPVAARCGDGAAALGEAWDGARAAQVKAAIAGGGRPFSAAVAARTAEVLDAYAARWRAAHQAACAAPFPADALQTARQLCLDDRRRVLGALSARLAADGGALGAQAVQAASALPSLEACTDVAALRLLRPLPDDPAAAARVLALYDDLAAAHASYLAGRHQEASRAAAAVAAAAAPLDYPPLVAEALLIEGSAAATIGDAGGTAALERAYQEAIAAGDNRAAMQTAAMLAQVIGFDAERVAEGRRWAGLADAHLRRIGDPPALRVKLRMVEANLAQTAGDYAAAQAGFAAAQEVFRALPGDHRVELGGALMNEGNALRLLGRDAESLARLEQAVGLWRETLGDDHPQLASAHGNLGAALRKADRLDDALVQLRRALAIDRANLGDAHPEVALWHDEIASTLGARGAWAEALPLHQQAEATLVAALGDDHVIVTVVRTNLGLAELELGRYADAEAHLRAALTRKQAVRGADHPSTAVNHAALGEVAARRGRHAAALASYRRALAVLEPAVGPDSPRLLDALRGIAAAQLALGDRAASQATLARVARIE